MPEPNPTIDELVFELLDSTYAASMNYCRENQRKEKLSLHVKSLYRIALRKTAEARQAMKAAYDYEHFGYNQPTDYPDDKPPVSGV